ncbi:NAD(P)H-dependent oxidoreductase [Nesterenkonia ebinurensis]|uniref:NAD(P)H-dependent oxidoreductase n=1 Tax=Nesterenkonia ebinurensis TaxID=2608252 RepID=UPI00123CC237|nr:NAD(P)H-dependent oxidoreductase [Nesterenkonia ebinurensis]
MSTVLVIDGHPNPDSLSAAIARAYADHCADARLLAVRDMDFDVHMRFGYTQRMPTEPDLADARRAIRAAQHLVITTPVWWRSTPAMLKGFLDRALLPKEDYRYTKRGLPEGLLTGRSARVFITADTPRVLQGMMPDSRLRSLTRGTLGFCGFKPVRVTRFAPVKGSTAQRRDEWLATVRHLAGEDAARLTPQASSMPQ